MHPLDGAAAPAWMRVLARRGSFLQLTTDGADAFSPRNQFAEAVGSVDRNRLAAAIEAGLLKDLGENRLGPSKRGIAALKAALIAASASKPITSEPGPAQRPAVNDAESPLGWLYRRRDKDGKALISEAEFAAGERLRADFWFAQMTPRVTTSWASDGFSSRRQRRAAPGAGIELQDRVIVARERVRTALQSVGPELSGILIDVCCHLKGLEEAERAIGWPQRSGKVVLQLALRRLARHYGLMPMGDPDERGKVRHWGAEDYRPTID